MMKLDKIETFVCANPPPRHGGRYFIFVRLTTECGISGVGEIYNATFGPELCASMAKEVFARHFFGSDPHHIERLWRRTYGAGYTMRPDVTVMGVLSALEIACWDIIGKAANRPVYDLLGGKVHERLRSYTYLYPADGDVYPSNDQPNVYNDPELAAEVARLRIEEGFTAIKFDPAGPYTIYDGHQPRLTDIELVVRFMSTMRKHFGTSVDLLFGTHGQFTVSGAKRMAKAVEQYDPLWFEEPIPPENPADMAQVAHYTSIPVSTGERLCTKHEFARVLEAGAASILQMDLGRVGGLLEAKKIASMAETRSAQIAPHLYCGPVVAAANIQIATATPNFLILESIGRFDDPYTSMVEIAWQWEDGYVIPPTEPGIGITLKDDVIKALPYTASELHLDMTTDAVV